MGAQPLQNGQSAGVAGSRLSLLLLDERADIHGFLAELDDADWQTPSLCSGWTVMDVAAHLASFLSASISELAVRMARAGFWPPRANTQSVLAWTDRGTQAIVDRLSGRELPGVAKVYAKVGLTEAVVHHQDMRRPLGRTRVVPEERLRVALGVIAGRPGTGTGGSRRGRGLKLQATDLDWSLGAGPVVSGPAEAILMTLAGRRHALDELSGEGTAALARRFR